MQNQIAKELQEHIRIVEQVLKNELPIIEKIANILITAVKNKQRIFWLGNGGSAADSQHLAAELVGRFLKERAPLASIALTVDTSILTAVSNDYGYEHVFARQVQALANKNDIIIGISTSGTSPNVLQAFKCAQKIGAINIGFCGSNTTLMSPYCESVLTIPAQTSPRIQECHILIGHILCGLIEQALYP